MILSGQEKDELYRKKYNYVAAEAEVSLIPGRSFVSVTKESRLRFSYSVGIRREGCVRT